MLDFIERHKIGILATILFHLLLITLFLILQLNASKPKHKSQVFIDFTLPENVQKDIHQNQEDKNKLSSKQFIKEMQKEYLGHNIAVNAADNSRQSVDKMITDIKKELNIKSDASQKTAQDKSEEPKPIKENDLKALPGTSNPDFTTNAKGERTFYKGPTTITYYLKGRMHVYVPVPVYQCQGSGKVSMDIEVDQNGYVVKASINKKESIITDNCLEEAATRAALSTRFDAKSTAPERESGWITYIFIAQ